MWEERPVASRVLRVLSVVLSTVWLPATVEIPMICRVYPARRIARASSWPGSTSSQHWWWWGMGVGALIGQRIKKGLRVGDRLHC
jgi:hypothetical protein